MVEPSNDSRLPFDLRFDHLAERQRIRLLPRADQWRMDLDHYPVLPSMQKRAAVLTELAVLL